MPLIMEFWKCDFDAKQRNGHTKKLHEHCHGINALMRILTIVLRQFQLEANRRHKPLVRYFIDRDGNQRATPLVAAREN
jgi:hypothetical protein